jgi:hypothetical protein
MIPLEGRAVRKKHAWHMSLPDESGVPAAIKMHFNKKAAEFSAAW